MLWIVILPFGPIYGAPGGTIPQASIPADLTAGAGFPYDKIYNAPDVIALPTMCQSTGDLNILVIGNSITYHPQTAEWPNAWGMAATTANNDYIHRLAESSANGLCKAITIKSAAAWRFEYGYADLSEFQPYRDYAPDIFILRLGDNVPEDSRAKALADQVCRLVDFIGAKKTIISDSFYPDRANADKALESAADTCADGFVDLSGLWDDPANHAFADLENYPPAILDHPGDTGMAKIAERIYAVLCNLLTPDRMYLPLVAR